MSTSDNVKDKVDHLVNILNTHAYQYYVHNYSTIADDVYDQLFVELRELEEKHPEFVRNDSPTRRIIGNVSEGFEPYKHGIPMLSIQTKTSDRDVIRDFHMSMQRQLGVKDISYIAEFKYDGLAMNLFYKDQVLTAAGTRGDGETGENIIENIRKIRKVPIRLNPGKVLPDSIEIRGEVVMTAQGFERVNQAQLAAGKKPYTNRRNAVAGIMRQLDSSKIPGADITFIPYGIGACEDWENKPATMGELFWKFHEAGFYYNTNMFGVCDDPALIQQFYDHVLKNRQEIQNSLFDIDGIVYKLNNFADQEKLGFRHREPKWAVAHKFPAEEAATTLNDIDVQIGRTGRLTPVARISPVFVGGTTVSNITLHNLFDIRRRGVRIGDKILVRRAGDVIPEIVGVFPGIPNPRRTFIMPKFCPVCGSNVVRFKGEVNHYCSGTNVCSAQIKRRLQHFVQRRAMDIEGMGDVVIDQLVDLKLVKQLDDIYRLTESDLKRLVGFADKKIINLLNAIDLSKICSLSRFIYALGIEDVGERASELLAQLFGSIQALRKATLMDLTGVKGIDVSMVENILKFFSKPENEEVVDNLILALDIKNPVSTRLSDKLTGVSIAMTGSPAVMKREDVKKLIIAHDGTVQADVNKKTTYLLVGEKGAAQRKIDFAADNGIPIITEADLLKMI